MLDITARRRAGHVTAVVRTALTPEHSDELEAALLGLVDGRGRSITLHLHHAVPEALSSALASRLAAHGLRLVVRPIVVPFQHARLGVVMRADPGNPAEAWGVLNPGAARGRDGELYLFPRLVARGNYSRIGRGRVHFTGAGDPAGVERLGLALEPRESYELNPRTGGGVEDPRVTYLEVLGRYVMAYTAYGPAGPRVALAVSRDLIGWERLGPVRFGHCGGVDLDRLTNKDAAFFPAPVRDPRGRPALALLHRPSFGVRTPGGRVRVILPDTLRERRDSMWLAYVPLEAAARDLAALTAPEQPTFLAGPARPWERLKIGAGTVPLATPHGWLMVYHGVRGRIVEGVDHQLHVHYSAGVMILDPIDPRIVRYRSPLPVLHPQAVEERTGIVPNVVFPTALEPRGDGRIDVYYGMGDSAIGAARMTIPATLPPAFPVAG